MGRAHVSKRLWRIIATLLGVLVFACPTTAALAGDEVIEITVLSSSLIRGDDLASARNAALDQGLNTAVQRAVEQVIPRKALAENLEKLGELLVGYGQGLVKEYRVLANAHTKNLYMVILSVSIVRADLVRALSSAGFELTRETVKKSALVFLQGSEIGLAAAQKAVKQALEGNGVALVESDSLDYDISQISVVTWADMGRQKGADLVLYCSWNVRCETPGEAVFSTACKGEAGVKWIDVASSELAHRSTVRAEVKEENAMAAEKRITEDLTARLFQDLSAYALQQPSLSERVVLPVKLTIENVTSYIQFEQVVSALRNDVPGVESVQLRSVIPGRFELEVRSKGEVSGLTQRLSGLSFRGFTQATRLDPNLGIVMSLQSSERTQ